MNPHSLLGKGTTVSITPPVAAAKSWNSFAIRVTLGSGGLPAGESLGLVCGSNIDRWQFQFPSHIWGTYAPWQVADPAAPGYLTATCSRAGVPLRVQVGRAGPLKSFLNQPDHLVRALRARYRYVLEVVGDRPLRKGDTITILWGDTRYGSPGVQAPALALNYYFLPFRFPRLPRFDRDLPSRQGRYEDLPVVRVTGGAAVRLHLTTPALAGLGESTRLHLAAVDAYGNLDETFTGTIRLKADNGFAHAPASLQLTPRDGGIRELDGLAIRRTGWGRFRASAGKISGASNAVLVTREAPAERLYFGEIHAHTLDCDGTATCRDHFDYARRVAGLDFGSISTHAEYFNGYEAWKRYLQDATTAHAPGRFVTFYGYEWAGEGHTNAYFKGENEVVNFYGKRILRGRHPADEPPFRIVCNRERRFAARIRNLPSPALCVAHYHARLIDPRDDDVIRLYEVFSNHQQNPLDERLRNLLAAGWRLGVVAGADTHRLPLGSLCADPDTLWRRAPEIDGEAASQSMQKKSGILAAFAAGLDRDSLWQGLWQRHTYGTTGARIVLRWACVSGAGCFMGETLALPPQTRPRFALQVGGMTDIEETRLFTYDVNARQWSDRPVQHPNGACLDTTFDAPPCSGPAIYYMRVTQIDRERAWSSPIWITRQPCPVSR